MLNKKIFWSSLSVFIAIQIDTAQASDLEEHATNYKETRNAYLKAANELKLATGPFKAAQKAYYNAVKTYVSSLNAGSPDDTAAIYAHLKSTEIHDRHILLKTKILEQK